MARSVTSDVTSRAFSCTGRNPNAPVTLTLQAQPGVHGWKGISLWSPSKGDLFEVSTDGDRRTSSVDIPPAALDASGLFLQFKKAKAFGVHTGMYWLSRPDKMLGNNIHFSWFHE